MTKADWLQLMGPILAALVLGVAGILGAVFTGITARLTKYLDSKDQAALSSLLADASARVQAAGMNEAGMLSLRIGAGQLDVTDLTALRNEAAAAADRIRAKLPEALDTLKPIQGAVAQMVLGKLGTLAAQAGAAVGPVAVAPQEPEPTPATSLPGGVHFAGQ